MSDQSSKRSKYNSDIRHRLMFYINSGNDNLNQFYYINPNGTIETIASTTKDRVQKQRLTLAYKTISSKYRVVTEGFHARMKYYAHKGLELPKVGLNGYELENDINNMFIEPGTFEYLADPQISVNKQLRAMVDYVKSNPGQDARGVTAMVGIVEAEVPNVAGVSENSAGRSSIMPVSSLMGATTTDTALEIAVETVKAEEASQINQALEQEKLKQEAGQPIRSSFIKKTQQKIDLGSSINQDPQQHELEENVQGLVVKQDVQFVNQPQLMYKDPSESSSSNQQKPKPTGSPREYDYVDVERAFKTLETNPKSREYYDRFISTVKEYLQVVEGHGHEQEILQASDKAYQLYKKFVVSNGRQLPSSSVLREEFKNVVQHAQETSMNMGEEDQMNMTPPVSVSGSSSGSNSGMTTGSKSGSDPPPLEFPYALSSEMKGPVPTSVGGPVGPSSVYSDILQPPPGGSGGGDVLDGEDVPGGGDVPFVDPNFSGTVASKNLNTTLGVKFHKEAVIVFFNSESNPYWDPDLEKNIVKADYSIPMAIETMQSIIDYEGSQILVSEVMTSLTSSKEDVVTELNEILQLHFSLNRNMSRGARIAKVGISLASLMGGMGSNVPVQPQDQSSDTSSQVSGSQMTTDQSVESALTQPQPQVQQNTVVPGRLDNSGSETAENSGAQPITSVIGGLPATDINLSNEYLNSVHFLGSQNHGPRFLAKAPRGIQLAPVKKIDRSGYFPSTQIPGPQGVRGPQIVQMNRIKTNINLCH